MSNWFHRNPLKATAKATFNLGNIAEKISARSICSDAASIRANLLKLLSDPAVSLDQILSKTQEYTSLLMGFVYPPENVTDQENRLRTYMNFKWSESVQHKRSSAVVQDDALFEVCSMLFNVALWFTKHAAKVASKEEVSEEEAKDIHRALRLAAGTWTLLRDQFVPNLLKPPAEGHDLHCDILEAYIQQSIGEAQEVAIAKAIERKLEAKLICGLANDTSVVYGKASLCLKSCDEKNVLKWIKYLEFKQQCYLACAYVYLGEYLLAQEKAGAAIAALKEAAKVYKKAVELAKVYGRVYGVGVSAKPAEHCFFRRLGQSIERTLAKIERENGLIFHQKALTVVPDLNLKAEFGQAKPETPDLSTTPDERWKDAYMGFNHTKLLEYLIQRDTKHEKLENKGSVEEIAEKPIYSTDKDPKNESGCNLS